ncbi:MAG: hypothetical protein ACREJD_04300 [Phycisphaerales bacterium]
MTQRIPASAYQRDWQDTGREAQVEMKDNVAAAGENGYHFIALNPKENPP